MKFNDKDIAQVSNGKSEIEGRLNYRRINPANYSSPPVFKERWFKLINNLLFYFKINDLGKIEGKHAFGAFVLENSKIIPEQNSGIPFAFSICFIDEPDKKHVFSARSQENVQQWVTKLRRASYEYMRTKLYSLQSKIFARTGKDPLLMVPRNEGSMKWAPSTSLSKPESCPSRTHKSSFHCHLEKEFHNTLTIRSTKVTTTDSSKETEQTYSKITEGKSTFFNRHNPFDLESLNVNIQPSRVAPSPPVRKKHSPNLPRNTNEVILNSLSFDSFRPDADKFHAISPPIKPTRRNCTNQVISNNVCNTNGVLTSALLNSQIYNERDQQVSEPHVANLIEF